MLVVNVRLDVKVIEIQLNKNYTTEMKHSDILAVYCPDFEIDSVIVTINSSI